MRGGLLEGFAVGDGRERISVSHLLYADDTLVFYRADVRQVCHL